MTKNKARTVTQFNIFDEPTVTTVKKSKRKMTDAEKRQKKEEREEKKRAEREKECDRKWAEKGVFQGELFPESLIKQVVMEQIERIVTEKSGIEIKPENKGKFTATKERTGKSTSELLNSTNPTTRKRANFARMAKRGWKPLKKD